MTNIHFLLTRLQKNSKFWILGLVVGLIALHLNLILSRVGEPGNINLLGTSVLSWAAILLLLWRKWDTLRREKDRFSGWLGAAIITLVMLTSAFRHDYVTFLHILPFISALGIFLFAFSFKGLKQYWQELLVILILAIPENVTTLLVGLPIFTASFATFVLFHLGFDVTQQQTHVMLSAGGVQVDGGCSGAVEMLQLLRLALLFLVLFPTKLSQKPWVKILVSLVAVLVGFIVNGFRVALLAVLENSFNQKAFDYWHVGEGSHIFSLTAVLLFGLFCYYLLLKDKPEEQDSVE